MSGEFPISLDPENISIRSDIDSVQSISQSGKRYSRVLGGHLWRLSITLPELTRREGQLLYSFLLSQRGTHDTFTILVNGFRTPIGNNAGQSPTYSGYTNDNKITAANFGSSIQDAVVAGDLFTIAGSEKVYMITEDADSDGSGNCNLKFHPEIVQIPAGGAAITFSDVRMTVALDGQFPPLVKSGFFCQQYKFDVIEAIA